MLSFQDKHEENHQPKLHGGLVIKHNANQRYATNAVTSFIFREIAGMYNIPTQVSWFYISRYMLKQVLSAPVLIRCTFLYVIYEPFYTMWLRYFLNDTIWQQLLILKKIQIFWKVFKTSIWIALDSLTLLYQFMKLANCCINSVHHLNNNSQGYNS